jgi:hypothetical protein
MDGGAMSQEVPDEDMREARQWGPALHVVLGEDRRHSPHAQFAGDQPVLIDARAIVIADESETGRLTEYQADGQQQQAANRQPANAVRGPPAAAVAVGGAPSIVRPRGSCTARIVRGVPRPAA